MTLAHAGRAPRIVFLAVDDEYADAMQAPLFARHPEWIVGSVLSGWRCTASPMRRPSVFCFIVHPDYATKGRAAVLHRQLIAMLRLLIAERDLWSALPGEVDRWWRRRGAMRVDGDADGWYIVGEGSERARLSWALRTAGGLEYTHDERVPAIPGGG